MCIFQDSLCINLELILDSFFFLSELEGCLVFNTYRFIGDVHHQILITFFTVTILEKVGCKHI